MSYEYFAQAFTVYEESISDSRSQFQAICIIAGALSNCGGAFGRENYDTLITKAALHGSKLLKKPDQCRAVYLASHLWWAVEKGEKAEGEGEQAKEVRGPDVLLYRFDVLLTTCVKLCRDPKRVLECLQRALRVADACHGHRGLRRAVRRDSQSIRVLFRPGERCRHDQVPQRTHRADTQQPQHDGECVCVGEPEEAFSEDAAVR